MDGDHLEIIGLGWALRYNNSIATTRTSQTDTTNVNIDADADDDDDEHRHFPPAPGGSDPHFIAPESYHHQSSNNDNNNIIDGADIVWNGFRDDLWAAGLVLYSMVVGTDALFTAPIAGDKIFTRLCTKGDVRGEVERYGKRLGKDYSNLLSDGLVDLLRSMLRADPKLRLSLEEVMEHPWVINDDLVVTPTEWTKLNRSTA